jgi:hypothetical protein
VWDKTIGSDVDDSFASLQQTSDGGYILGGGAGSGISGDKTHPGRGGFDYWMVKLDAAGNKQWDKAIGGDNQESLYDLQLTRDGGYILGGFSDSDISGDKTELRRGECERPYDWWTCPGDYWVVKLAAEVPPPQLSAFSPIQGLPGTVVTLTGQHLVTTQAVLFNGLAAAFEVVSDSAVKATVPANAASGNITLETEGGQATTSAVFTVLQPEIAAFFPFQGKAGSRVYLAGKRLSTTGKVYFNGVRSPRVKVYADRAISAVVPEGATTGKLRVELAGGGTDLTKSEFIITLSPAPLLPDLPLARKEPPASVDIPPPQVMVFPNPFHEEVNFTFSLTQPQPVEVKVYDVLGREIGLLYRGEVQARQANQVVWRPGAQLPAGLYIICLQTPGQDIRKRVVLTR